MVDTMHQYGTLPFEYRHVDADFTGLLHERHGHLGPFVHKLGDGLFNWGCCWRISFGNHVDSIFDN